MLTATAAGGGAAGDDACEPPLERLAAPTEGAFAVSGDGAAPPAAAAAGSFAATGAEVVAGPGGEPGAPVEDAAAEPSAFAPTASGFVDGRENM